MIIDKLTRGRLVKRYKRFLADVRLESGEEITAHCPNPGSMLGCSEPGSTVFVRLSDNPKRKLPYTLTIIDTGPSCVVVDTGIANKLVPGAIKEDRLESLAGYKAMKTEPKYKDSRFDVLLSNTGAAERKDARYGEGDCLIEIKSTTLSRENVAMFPDARTERGLKHLNRLVEVVGDGARAVQFYVISRCDTTAFRSASHIDPDYAEALIRSKDRGLEVMAWDICIDLSEDSHETGDWRASVDLRKSVPVEY